jgi:glycosyltransferase 2 family protein
MLVARIALPVLALFFLWQRLGAEAFRPALEVVAPAPLLAGLILGGLAVLAQAARWRVLMAANGIPIGRPEAFAECYRSSALNAVLPGGVAGDVLRAWRQRARAPQGWRPAAGSVLADRMAGLCLLLAAAAVVLVVQSELLLAAACAGGSLVAWAVARPQLRRLNRRQRAGVWGWSAAALASLLALSVAVAVTLGVDQDAAAVATLGLALLAGMAVPLNLGGWGPREAAGALAALLVGAEPEVGVAVAAGYGLLSTVSVLPGFVVLVLGSPVRRGVGQVELDADVLAERETSHGGTQRVGDAVPALEPQPGDSVAHEERRSGHQ